MGVFFLDDDLHSFIQLCFELLLRHTKSSLNSIHWLCCSPMFEIYRKPTSRYRRLQNGLINETLFQRVSEAI